MSSGKVTLVPAESDSNIRAVRELGRLLQSSMCPSGSGKLFVTGGGIAQLALTSNTVLERLELENPICRCIGQVSRGLPDFGLGFGVLVSKLLEQMWLSSETIQKQKLQRTVGSLAQNIQNLLASEYVCRKVDFSSVNSFLSLVNTVVSSKCSTFLADLDKNKFCLEIVKLFLNCIDEQSNKVGRIYIKVESGTDLVSSHNGLLYQIVEDYDLGLIKDISGSIKILVFSCKIETSVEINSSTRNDAITVLNQADELNVKIVACQKTVSAEVRMYLMRKQIVLLDRMGTDFTTELLKMTQAFPISHLDLRQLHLTKMVGELTSVQHVQFNEADYALLQNEKVSVGTLLIRNRSLAETEHLKVLAGQAVGALRTLAVHPFLTFGGGCLEAWLVGQLEMLKANDADKDCSTISLWIQKALLAACGPTPPSAIDSTYNHAWDEDTYTSCRCGFVTQSQLEQAGGQLVYLSEITNSCSKIDWNPPSQLGDPLHSHVLVDCHQQKTNSLVTALETFINLSDIGMILYENEL